jgi:hypothetical protein
MFNIIDLNLFNVGDEIEFETCAGGQQNQPRWNFDLDLGGSGKWAYGKIIFIDDQIIQVEYEIEGYIGKGNCTWPNTANRKFNFEQWDREGYLKLREEKPKQIKCECGGDKLHIPHSDWCPKYNMINV